MKPAEQYLRVLQQQVAHRLGRPVTTKADCRALSESVLQTTCHLLSENTLGRFFGILPPVVPRQATLDILAQYCGHPHYNQFCQWADHQLHQPTHAQGSDPTYFSAQVLRLCLQNGQYDTVVQAFGMLPNSLDYYAALSLEPTRHAELVAFVDVLADELRRNPVHIRQLLPQLARLPQGRLLVYEFSVDRLYREPAFIHALQSEYARWQPEPDEAHRTEKLVFVHATTVRALAESNQLRQARRLWAAELEKLPAEAVSHSQGGLHIYPVTRYWVERSRIHAEPAALHQALDVLQTECEAFRHAEALHSRLFSDEWVWQYLRDNGPQLAVL